MKKLLCFLGIVMLLFLIALPPILRYTLPNMENNKEEVKSGLKYLTCTSDSYITRTNYKDEKTQLVVIKKINQKNLEEDSSSIENESNFDNLNDQDNNTLDILIKEDEDETVISSSNKEMDKFFTKIKTDSNITYNKVEDGETVLIDFSISVYPSVDLSSISQNLSDQQAFYENDGFVCNIIEE